MRKMARQLIDIGCRDFCGPIEETTRIPKVKELLKRAIQKWIVEP